MGAGAVCPGFQYIPQLTQLVKSLVEPVIQCIQIIFDTATAIRGSIRHVIQMLGGILSEFFQCRFIALRIVRYGDGNVSATDVMIAIATPVTIPNVISTDGNVMTVAVIFVIIRLLVQIVIQDFQIVADAVQLLIVNIPQIMSGPGQRTSRIVGILQVRTDTLGNTGCLFAIATHIFLGGIQHIQEFVCLRIQFLQLVTEILDFQERLHLTHDTAHIFSALHISGVGAVLQIALMQSAYDTSGIVAYVLVADGPGIGAIINLTIRNTCDTAGVRMSCHIGGTVDLLQIVHGDIFQIISHFRAVRIDIAIVAAVIQNTVVVAHNTACGMIADHISGGFTPTDLSALGIDSGNTADIRITDHISGKFTIFNAAIVHTDDTADLILTSRGRYFPRDRKVADFCSLLHIAEQSHCRTVSGQFHIGNSKTAAVKDSCKRRNTEFTCHAQNNVVLQHYFFISGPTVQYTVLHQFPQILLRADLYDCIILLLYRAAITAAASVLLIGQSFCCIGGGRCLQDQCCSQQET